MLTLQKAEAADHVAAEAMDRYVIVKSTLYTSGERDPRKPPEHPDTKGKPHLMHHDPRLPRMPDKPTLFDFFRLRFGPSTHLLQSARLAQKNGCSEKIVLACLIHDIATGGFIRADHGYWAAQMLEPYVDEAGECARQRVGACAGREGRDNADGFRGKGRRLRRQSERQRRQQCGADNGGQSAHSVFSVRCAALVARGIRAFYVGAHITPVSRVS
jgi:hypothetical protein